MSLTPRDTKHHFGLLIRVRKFGRLVINGILSRVHWFRPVVISLDLEYVIGMDKLGGRQKHYIGFLVCEVKVSLEQNFKWNPLELPPYSSPKY